jgi:hypothetical protein
MNRKASTIFNKADRYSSSKKTTSSSFASTSQPTIFQLGGVIVLKEFTEAKSVLIKYQDLQSNIVEPENAISKNKSSDVHAVSINTLQKC